MKYWNKICGLFMIFLFQGIFLHAQTLKYVWYEAPGSRLDSGEILSFSNLKENKKLTQPATSLQVIKPDYYTQHFEFFCKKELAVEKFTKIPFRFRLGSLQQCNYLEGKK